MLQTAVAIELLMHVPMRLNNLRELRLGMHLMVGSAAMPLTVGATAVKNGVSIDASLPFEAMKLLTLYVERYRPLLAPTGGDWLFPGPNASVPKSADGLRTSIKRVLAEHCGLVFTPHMFRHFAAWLILQNNPTAHGQVQRVLGHKSMTSTMTFYSGLERMAALEHYDGLIAQHRQTSATGKSRKGSR
jgi:integrase